MASRHFLRLRDDLLQVRSVGVNFYVLRDDAGLYLVDGGFLCGQRRLQHALRQVNWTQIPIRGIIVTHGHLDHILHVSRIAKETGAWIAAPRLDAPHFSGQPRYRDSARLTGLLEKIGRPLLGFSPFTPTRWLDDGDALDVWHGLTTMHLPGHTAGHCGFYCAKLKLLFSADLFASFGNWSHFPPRFFNQDNAAILHSAAKALSLDLHGILPNHADTATPETHLARLRNLFLRAKKNTC